MEKRLQQILARKAEIRNEIAGADEQRLKELDSEAETLLQEEADIRSRMDLTGKLGNPVDKPVGRGGASEAEKRARNLREKRSVTVTSGKLAQPTATAGIGGDLNGISSIVDMVKVTDCSGMGGYKVAYLSADASADKSNEGASNESDAAFAYAEIQPVTITTYSEISREAMNLTDLDYLSAVQQSALRALKRKVANLIINSDAASSAKFIGVLAAPAIKSTSDVEITAIGADTLRKIALSYGGADAIEGNAVLFLSRKDLIAFGDVRGTSEKKAVYEITPDTANPSTGVIREGGLAVRYCLNSNLTDFASQTAGKYSMIYGIPTCYELGLFSDYSIRVSEDAAFKNRMLAVLGEVMIGGNVTVANGFVRVKKKASS